MNFHNLLNEVYDNIFNFNNTNILVLFDKNNSVWLSYNSVLKSIGYSDIKKLKKRLDIDDKYFDSYENIYNQSKLNKIKADYQKPNEKMINEAGMYYLLEQSSKKVAKELSKKLFTEVLPELRKKGKFFMNTTEQKNMKKLTKKIKLYQKEINRTQKISHKNESGNGFIYILKIKTIQNGSNKTCYKIGYTSDLNKRLATYKTGNPDIELVYSENLKCDKTQLEKCILSLNTLKLLKNRTEVICNISLKEIKEEINDCKELLKKHS
jgi:prophage antirepressor-like protein